MKQGEGEKKGEKCVEREGGEGGEEDREWREG